MQSGFVSNIQRYSLHDGPGIRTTVFLKGCPLRCLWCHNPENCGMGPEIVTVETRCIRCGACAGACPVFLPSPARGRGAGGEGSLNHEQPLGNANRPHPATPSPPSPASRERVDGSSCRICGACVAACPTGARQTVGQTMSTADVLAEVRKDAIFYEESSGGATFSGGEPLAQAEFLIALLEACRTHDIHTALDTCGYAPTAHLLAAAARADLVLYDLKAVDDDRHRRFTGVSNRLILENLLALSAAHNNIWLRIPLVPGLNDAADELDAMARLAAGVPGVRQVNLLPYHRTGAHKFPRLGYTYELPDVEPPTPEQMESVRQRFTAAGLMTKVGG